MAIPRGADGSLTNAAIAADAPALWLAGITKRFGAVLALDDVSFTVRRGTVHALLGENGAGKTTLMRIANGLVAADAGRAHRDGRALTVRTPADAIAARMGMVHQHFSHVGRMTVAENVSLGRRGLYSQRAAREVVRESAARAGLALDADTRVEALSVGAQQRLEIIKALSRDATLLVFDEPTAVLAPSESAELLAWICGFANEGNAAVLITHKLRDALSIADDVTVLRRGRVALAAQAREVDEAAIASAMLGAASPRSSVPAPTTVPNDSAIVWSARDACVRDDDGVERLRDATLAVRRGEIVGVVGVEGSGTRELLRLAAGRVALSAGSVSAASDVGFIPEDRHADGLVLDFTLAENVALRGAGARRGIVAWRAMRDRAQVLLARGGVVPNDSAVVAKTLSGGNQQKLVFARESDGEPPLVVAENPTRGLDIRATEFVYEELRAASARGAAVLIHSSDLDEVLALATRLVAVHAGRVIEVPVDRDAAGRAMLGLPT